MELPKVTFVILNWNQGELTADCLRSLKAQSYPNFDVVVVDNGSTDGSPQRLRKLFPEFTLLESEENLGYSEGNNLGIVYVLEQESDYIFLLNNDTEVHAEMLARLVSVAEIDPLYGMVGPTMFYADPPNMIWSSSNYIDWRRADFVKGQFGEAVSLGLLEQREPEEVDYIDTCAVLIKRQVLEKTGLMNARYFINFDDLDLNLRARLTGYKIVYVPSAFMWHKVSAAMGQASPATTYYMTRNTLLFFWSHAPGVWKVIAPLRVILRTARTIVAWTLKSEYQTQLFRRRRAANVLALRDFFTGRFGRMGADVALICSGK